ncbi:MAG: tRNA (guanosine(37)-N1)-methyltransferase TrmD [Armatimonadetes bacterium]|nr:tRNA (guanosine(37)-N1)-methyltransferase TrmD [Armatimonadota bacterium]
MRIDILTIFPGPVRSMLGYSIIGRARERGALTVEVHDLRDWTTDRHRSTDDYPYGGGAGMVMKPEPVCEAVDDLRGRTGARRVVYLTPQGRPLTQALVEELAAEEALILVSDHYEGLDERARQLVITDEISLGDYLLTGGELPALVLTDAVARLQPDVLGSLASTDEESFVDGLLEYPHYTRPREYRGLEVPEVLAGGNHAAIRAWRRRESIRRTWERRPDLLEHAELDDDDETFLAELRSRPPEEPS